MKNLAKISVAAVIVLAACSKEKPAPASAASGSVAPSQQIAQPQYELRILNAHRYFYDNGNIPGVDGVDYGCKAPANDCLDDVTGTAGNQTTIDNMWTEVTTQSATHIQSYFSSNQNTLSTIMPYQLVNAVVNGTGVTATRGSAPGTRYLIFKNTSGTIVAVQPYI